ncbi:MAG: hypothetical protein GXO27_06110 [Chlorobi bacterium]|nr:hypothetical protein [Chlorobiota bacterium]
MRKLPVWLAAALAWWGVTAGRAQEADTARIEVEHADRLVVDEHYPGLKLLVGNVRLRHKDAVLISDKALLDTEKNFAEAIGRVRLDQGDSLHIRAGILRYDGNAEAGVAMDTVVMYDPVMELRTDTLYYDAKRRIAYYDSGGTVRDSVNVLTSRAGRYEAAVNRYVFSGDVRLVHPDYTIESARLEYNTDSRTAVFLGPTVIRGNDGQYIYAERGFYDTRRDMAWFTRRAYMESGATSLRADSVYMDREREFYSAAGRVRMQDTANRVITLAGYAEQWRARDSIYLSGNPVVINYEPGSPDSLYLNARTIRIRGPREAREFFAYPDVRFIGEGYSGRADSLYRSEARKILELHGRPVIWSGESQITGSRIIIVYDSTGTRPDSLIIPSRVFIIQKDSAGFNQIKGKELRGKFIDGKLRHVRITGNAEMIYHVRDDRGRLIGIDKSICSEIEIFLDAEGQIEKVVLREMPEGVTYPPDKFPKQIARLPGFVWLEDERITDPSQLLEDRRPRVEKPSAPPSEPSDEEALPRMRIPRELLKNL